MTTESFDVVIVGSGPIGSAFARIISDEAPDSTILMVESGPIVATPPGRHIKTITDPAEMEQAQINSQGPFRHKYGKPDPLQNVEQAGQTRTPLAARPGTFLVGERSVLPGEDGMPAAAMASNVGGMGSHWTCACPAPGDGERIELIPRAEFDELFAKAWELLHVTQHGFDNAPLGAELREALGELVDDGRPADRRVQPMPLGITVNDGHRYWTGPDVILGDLAGGHAGFTLRPDTIARKINHDSGTVTGVELHDAITGRDYTVRAGTVVVAADSFRTPQLLFASGIRPAALGRYLNDHPQALGVVRLKDSMLPDTARPTHTQAGEVDALSGVNWVPYDRDRFPYHAQIMQFDASPVPIVGVEETWPGSVVGIGLFGCKDIQAEDRLVFDENELDAFGLPAISIHYNLTPADHQLLNEMVDTITRLAGELGELVNGLPPVIMPNGSSLHYMGTIRLGAADDGTSVCDPYGAVWQTQNLYVGGNGVIPTATACNPTATSVAIAVRSARQIADRLTAQSPERVASHAS